MSDSIDGTLVVLGWIELLALGIPLGMGIWMRLQPPCAARLAPGLIRGAGLMATAAALLWLWQYAVSLLPDAEAVTLAQGLGLLAGTRLGLAALVHAALCLAGAVALLAGAHRLGEVPVLACSGAGVASFVLLGHAAAVPGLSGWLQMGVLALHILFAVFWLGAIASLLTLGLPTPLAPSAAGRRLARAMQAFGRPGIATVATLLTSGFLMADWRADPTAWLGALRGMSVAQEPSYAGIVMVKVGLFLLMGVCALINRQVLIARLSGTDASSRATRAARWNLSIEFTLGLGAAGAALVLAGLSPPY